MRRSLRLSVAPSTTATKLNVRRPHRGQTSRGPSASGLAELLTLGSGIAGASLGRVGAGGPSVKAALIRASRWPRP
jgi:hypothetical protein